MKNLLSLALRLTLSVGLLIFVFSKLDLGKTVDILRTADPVFILFAGLIFLVTQAFLLLRWRIFIKALELPVGFASTTTHFFYGAFGNLFLPTAIGGDLLKAVGLCRNSDQKPKVIASILLDRLSGFAGIALLAVIAFVFGHRMIGDNSLIVPIALMGAGSLLVAFVLFNERIYGFACQIFNALPRIKKALMNMHYDIALLKKSHKTKEGYKALFLAIVGQMIYACVYYLTARALHQEIALIYFLVFIPIICVASSLPSIGGLGVREAGSVYLFTKIGVNPEIAVSLTLIGFLFMVLVGLTGGVFYVYSLFAGRIQHSASNEGARVRGF